MRSHRHESHVRRLTAVGILCALTACTFDRTDWEVYPADDDERFPERPTFGVGLQANIAVCLQQHESHLCTPPDNLQIIADEPSKVRITTGGRVRMRDPYYSDVESPNARLVQVEALEPGANRLRFVSEDTEEVAFLSYDARAPVAFKGFSTLSGARTDSKDTELWAFTGATLESRARFAVGGTDVLGTRPWRFLPPAGSGTVLDHNTLRLGSKPHDLTLEVDGAPSPLRIHVRPPSEIAGIFIQNTSGSVTQFDGNTLTMRQGYNVFLQLHPLYAGDVPFLGASHPPPTGAVVSGSAMVAIGCAVPADCLGFRAEALGEATLRFTWGSAVKVVQARVVPNP